MKNKKWWQKLKNGNTRLVILAVVSFSAGISMMVAPEKTSHWIIRGVGLIWTLEAISYCLDIRLNYLKKQKEALTIHSVSNRFDSKYTPPFRVGRKQGKAVLDANGIDVVFFSNSEEQARKYCDYLNGC